MHICFLGDLPTCIAAAGQAHIQQEFHAVALIGAKMASSAAQAAYWRAWRISSGWLLPPRSMQRCLLQALFQQIVHVAVQALVGQARLHGDSPMHFGRHAYGERA